MKRLLFVVLLIFASFSVVPVGNSQNGSITFESNTITVSGFSEETPCTFQDIYDADVAGGWGVVWNRENQFVFDAELYIGDGENQTWFADTNKQVFFSDMANDAFDVENNGHFRSGTLLDESRKITSDGCSFYIEAGLCIYSFVGSDVKFYDTKFVDVTGGASLFEVEGNMTLYSCAISNFDTFTVYDTATLNVWNTLFQNFGGYGLDLSASVTLEKVTFLKTWVHIFFSESGTVRDLYGRNATYTSIVMANSVSDDCYLINADLDIWDVTCDPSPYRVFRQYEFSLNVTDSSGVPIEGANVTVSHYGQGYTQDFSVLTASNGSFSTKTLTMGFYNQTGANTIYNYNPHQISITHEDYDTKTFNFTLTEKTKWIINLEQKASFSLGFMLGFILFMVALVLGLCGYAYKKR